MEWAWSGRWPNKCCSCTSFIALSLSVPPSLSQLSPFVVKVSGWRRLYTVHLGSYTTESGILWCPLLLRICGACGAHAAYGAHDICCVCEACDAHGTCGVCVIYGTCGAHSIWSAHGTCHACPCIVMVLSYASLIGSALKWFFTLAWCLVWYQQRCKWTRDMPWNAIQSQWRLGYWNNSTENNTTYYEHCSL